MYVLMNGSMGRTSVLLCIFNRFSNVSPAQTGMLLVKRTGKKPRGGHQSASFFDTLSGKAGRVFFEIVLDYRS